MVITGNTYAFSHATKVIQKNETTKYFSIFFFTINEKKVAKKFG